MAEHNCSQTYPARDVAGGTYYTEELIKHGVYTG